MRHPCAGPAFPNLALFFSKPRNAACRTFPASVDTTKQPVFATAASDSPAGLAAALAAPVAAGHFDELRGSQPDAPAAAGGIHPAVAPDTAPPPLAAHWAQFFGSLGTEGFKDLDRRTDNLKRQIRDNGVTYNVYADADGPQRPWSLDLFPLIIPAADWAGIASGVAQRARLLDRVMADVYGPQGLLRAGLLPAALVHGHPGYVRAMQGLQPPGGQFLHIAAFDLARGPDGRWAVVSQRTQAPSGLGYLLENRLTCSLLFPEAFRDMRVEALAASYTALVDAMKARCPAAGRQAGSDSRIVLLTPGPYNETYFEHAYLARYLGLTLVEGSDLLVRDEKLYLKTLQGLEPVHGLLKRLDDEFLDPLELRSDSTLGVPGLLQAIRAGNVLVANTPGSAFLESTALLGFLPALSRRLLDEPLLLPSLPTWWCGERAVLPQVLGDLKNYVIKPTYPAPDGEAVIARTLGPRALAQWAARIEAQGENHTVQAFRPLSKTPAWQGGRIAPRAAMLRVFALADGAGGWQVLPGGLARLAGRNDHIASMQHGGSSADVWVLAGPAPEAPSPSLSPAPMHAPPGTPPLASPGAESLAVGFTSAFSPKRPVTSRAAENLFWLGRYTERCENSVRLAQLTLQALGGEDQGARPLLSWLTEMAAGHGLVPPGVPAATQARRVFERALVASLARPDQPGSIGYNLRALKNAALALRERLSLEQWQVIVRMQADFTARCEALTSAAGTQKTPYSSVEALRALESTSGYLAAATGAQTDRMMRDGGWQLMSVGRHIERLGMLSDALLQGFATGAVQDGAGFRALLSLFDSTITFHAQYQQRRDLPALLDLLLLDRDNPRSIAGVVQRLQGRVSRLDVASPQAQPARGEGAGEAANILTALLPVLEAGLMSGESLPLAAPDATGAAVLDVASVVAFLQRCHGAAFELSDALGRRYFSHAAPDNHSVGA
jgi:uncharacterized circularly permuted ATP-grasp superfamily protein/uncharacterized alpha-E superfamily protein